MKKLHTAVILACAFILLLLIGWATRTGGETVQAIASSTPPVLRPTDRQEIWINALEWCESKGRPDAVNPKDRDNTPSYGILQFKPGTYAFYAKQYKLASTTDYMNPIGQKTIVEHMVLDSAVNWEQQFPDCVQHHIGRPPKQ